MSIVSTKTNANLAIIIIDNPPVNALSHAVRLGVSEQMEINAQKDNIEAIILMCAGRTFCAGADISEFGKPPLAPGLPELIEQIERTNKPVIAALHGTTLGGGFELALSCHYRIMDVNAKVGLPEVHLGLIPGASGTQRLPRLIGAEAALEMITSGKAIGASKAEKLGIIDQLSSENLENDAILFTQQILKENQPIKRISDLNVQAQADVFDNFRKKITKKSRGYLAPDAAIRAVEAAVNLPYEQGLIVERDEFATLLSSSQSIGQRHLFFAERMAGKIPDIDKTTPVREIKSTAVIGGGTMGCGIAINFLNAGLPVKLLEISSQAADAARDKIEKIYLSSVKKGRISQQKMETTLALLTCIDNYDDLADEDLIIEAVFENMDVKKQVFAKLDQMAKPGAILATNTSFLDVNEIASSTGRPEDVIGLHFFSPAHIMPLLEIVRTEKNSPSIVATALKIGKMIGKTSVVSGVCYGFIANRMASCYSREAGLLLLEGASVEQIDKTLYDFGMPMGMFEMLDLAGIDIGVMARNNRPSDSYDNAAFQVHDSLVNEGHKGQKTGMGFYQYSDGNKLTNPKVQELAIKFAAENGIKRREISNQEIEERCVFTLINEGYKIIEEGIALRQSDVDVVYAMGFGFPRYRGGPLHYANHIGLKVIVEKIEKFAKLYGARWWTPSKLLIEQANKE